MWEIWNTASHFSFSPFTSFVRPLPFRSAFKCLVKYSMYCNAAEVCIGQYLHQTNLSANKVIKVTVTYLQVTSVTPKPTLQNSQNAQFKKVFSFLLLMSVWYDYNSHVKRTALTVNAYRHIFLVFFSSHLEENWLKGKGRGAVMAFISNAGSETLQRSCVK